MKKLKVNDEVIVTTGKNAGKVGKIVSLKPMPFHVVMEIQEPIRQRLQ